MPNSYSHSESVRDALARARTLAQDRDAGLLEPEHMLLALLQKRGLVTDALERCRISVPTLRENVEVCLGPRSTLRGVAAVPYSDRAAAVLTHAANEAADLGDVSVDVEHIFLGALQDRQISALWPLVEAGLTLETARAMLLLVRAGRF